MFDIVRRSLGTVKIFGFSGVTFLFDYLFSRKVMHQQMNGGMLSIRNHKVKYKNRYLYYRCGTTDPFTIMSILVGFKDSTPLCGEYDVDINFLPDRIIDLGANIGIASVFFSEAYRKTKIIALEPEDTNLSLLRKNTEGIDAKIIKAAVWWRKSNLILISEAENQKDAFRVIEVDESEGDSFEGIDIDTIISQYCEPGEIILIKMDVEGAEKEIIEHLEDAKWIHTVQGIMMEIHDQMYNNLSNRIIQVLGEYGFGYRLQGDIYYFYRDQANP